MNPQQFSKDDLTSFKANDDTSIQADSKLQAIKAVLGNGASSSQSNPYSRYSSGSTSKYNTNGIDRRLIDNLPVVDRHRTGGRSGAYADATDGEKAVIWALETKAQAAAGVQKINWDSPEILLQIQNSKMEQGTWDPSKDGYYYKTLSGDLAFDKTGEAKAKLAELGKTGSWEWLRDNGYDYTEGGLMYGTPVKGPKGGYNKGITDDPAKKGDYQKALEAVHNDIKPSRIIPYTPKTSSLEGSSELATANKILAQAGIDDNEQRTLIDSFIKIEKGESVSSSLLAPDKPLVAATSQSTAGEEANPLASSSTASSNTQSTRENTPIPFLSNDSEVEVEYKAQAIREAVGGSDIKIDNELVDHGSHYLRTKGNWQSNRISDEERAIAWALQTTASEEREKILASAGGVRGPNLNRPSPQDLDKAKLILAQAGLDENEQKALTNKFLSIEGVGSSVNDASEANPLASSSTASSNTQSTRENTPIPFLSNDSEVEVEYKAQAIREAVGGSDIKIDNELIRNVDKSLIGPNQNWNSRRVSDEEKAIAWALETKAKVAAGMPTQSQGGISAAQRLQMQNNMMANGKWKPSDGYYFKTLNGDIAFDPTGMSANNRITNPENYMPDPRAPGETGPYGIPDRDGYVKIPELQTSNWQWLRDNGYDYTEGGTVHGAKVSGPKGAYSTGWTDDPALKSDAQIAKETREAAILATPGVKIIQTASQAQAAQSNYNPDLEAANLILAQAGLDENEQKALTNKFLSIEGGGLSPSLLARDKSIMASTGQITPVDESEEEKSKSINNKTITSRSEYEDKKSQALALSPVDKKASREERLKKIMEMRKPYMGGAASVNGSSDAMVVPPIVPASQVPPPPLP